MADIAHQLRTPLTTANLILSLLEKNPQETERKRLLWETKEVFSQMDWLLVSLLKLSRLDAGIIDFQKEDIVVRSLLENALRQFLISMDLHNMNCDFQVSDDIRINVDRMWLSEAIANIYKNCIESMQDNGTLSIGCEDNVLYTEIEIRDSGKGFSKEDLKHVFDRFYHGKNSNKKGYGIGLALARSIISHQGGTIHAKNHIDGGAAFYIRFPK